MTSASSTCPLCGTDGYDAVVSGQGGLHPGEGAETNTAGYFLQRLDPDTGEWIDVTVNLCRR